ncbi:MULTISPECIES: HNH endonuclease [unclassified Streptomyces]|uniref:HNH endonuclease n=1 Tax=unclassified Streptomyces TaxID=2593676 RepID=UPI000939E759|nr:SMI1/KNR4 family protein [Streptomyces sp. TSRI0281]OKI45853.1 hypothetical protein A6A29_30220 [Streptomyces sp. TSRI0281]
MTESGTEAVGSPTSEFAGGVVDFALTQRSREYPDGLYVGLLGFPDFLPYARIVIESGPMPPGLGIDEARVTDVLASNIAAAGTGDPLYANAPETATPRGWTWHHDPLERRFLLLPVDVKNNMVHHGGVATMRANRARTGLWSPVAQPRVPAVMRTGSGLSDGDLSHLESKYLEHRLPESYRTFMIENGGGPPEHAIVHPDLGFVLDQQFFNLYGDPDPYDLLDNAVMMADRLTAEYLPIAWVQGGALVLKTRGTEPGSILYWDNDDRRTQQGDTPEIGVSRLEYLADDIFTLLGDELIEVPARLEEISRSAVSGGFFHPVTLDNAGAGLPADLRA